MWQPAKSASLTTPIITKFVKTPVQTLLQLKNVWFSKVNTCLFKGAKSDASYFDEK